MAIKLTRSDLKFEYTWTAYPSDDPKISGHPDDTLFNRQQGYEVLYLINKLLELWNWNQKESGLRIEKLIKTDLPGNIRSQKNMKEWLSKNL